MVGIRLPGQLPERNSQLDGYDRGYCGGFFLGICSVLTRLLAPVPGNTADVTQLTARMYFSASSFRTIDGGLNRLPLSFHPHVDNVTILGRKIEQVTFDNNENKVTLHWRDNFTRRDFHSSSYDYAVISVPFSIVRKWRLPPLAATISNAIQNVPYMSGCKVALEFSTRFWEHFDEPIFGGCSTTTDIPGIGEICYPSYNLNGTGPATVLASWQAGPWGERWVGISEDEHVQYVLDTMVEIHGDFVRELYTGKYRRKCWLLDEVGGWAHPSVGQHQLYLPEYFKTHSNVSEDCRFTFFSSSYGGSCVNMVIPHQSDDLCRRTHVVHTGLDSVSTGVWHSRRGAASSG